MKRKKKEETFRVKGEELLAKVNDIVHEGNVRRIIISDKNNNVFVEFPLTLGVIGTVISPVLAGIGAIAALVTECTITVKRK